MATISAFPSTDVRSELCTVPVSSTDRVPYTPTAMVNGEQQVGFSDSKEEGGESPPDIILLTKLILQASPSS